MKNILSSVCLCILVSGCATSEVSEEGKKIELTKEEPKNCKLIGDIDASGKHPFNSSLERAKAELRNKAAKMGANLVVMDLAGPHYEISGRAFNCSK